MRADRRDAVLVAKSHRAGDLDSIHVPDPGDEAIQDFCWTFYVVKQDGRSGRR